VRVLWKRKWFEKRQAWTDEGSQILDIFPPQAAPVPSRNRPPKALLPVRSSLFSHCPTFRRAPAPSWCSLQQTRKILHSGKELAVTPVHSRLPAKTSRSPAVAGKTSNSSLLKSPVEKIANASQARDSLGRPSPIQRCQLIPGE